MEDLALVRVHFEESLIVGAIAIGQDAADPFPLVDDLGLTGDGPLPSQPGFELGEHEEDLSDEAASHRVQVEAVLGRDQSNVVLGTLVENPRGVSNATSETVESHDDDRVYLVQAVEDGAKARTVEPLAAFAGRNVEAARSCPPLRHDYSWVKAVAFSPDGRWLGTGIGGNRAVLWVLAALAPIVRGARQHLAGPVRSCWLPAEVSAGACAPSIAHRTNFSAFHRTANNFAEHFFQKAKAA